jgi:hypothetical protein
MDDKKIKTITIKIDTKVSLDRVLSLSLLSISGLVGITTFLMAMVAPTFIPPASPRAREVLADLNKTLPSVSGNAVQDEHGPPTRENPINRGTTKKAQEGSSAISALTESVTSGATTAAAMGGTDYYVKKGTGCLDAYPACGTETSPFEDIDQCSSIMQPGDTCHIMTGIYAKGYKVYQPINSGTASGFITFRSYKNHLAIIKPGAPGECALGWRRADGEPTGLDYITYQGLQIDGTLCISGESGTGNHSESIALIGNNITAASYRNPTTTIQSAITVELTDNFLIYDNAVHTGEPIGGPYDDGINFDVTTFGNILQNDVYDNGDGGIANNNGNTDDTITISRNNLYGNQKRQMIITGRSFPDAPATNIDIFENIIDCTNRVVSNQAQYHYGILVESNVHDSNVYSNTLVNCWGMNSFPGTLASLLIVGPHSFPSSCHENNRFWNNLYFTGGPQAVSIGELGGCYDPAFMDYNFYEYKRQFAWNIGTLDPPDGPGPSLEQTESQWKAQFPTYDTNSYFTDIGNIKFVNRFGYDYHLRSTSEAKGVGCDNATGCTTTTTNSDIGAYPRDDATIIGALSQKYICEEYSFDEFQTCFGQPVVGVCAKYDFDASGGINLADIGTLNSTLELCEIEPICGNGIIEPPEQCDSPGDGTCTTQCTFSGGTGCSISPIIGGPPSSGTPFALLLMIVPAILAITKQALKVRT